MKVDSVAFGGFTATSLSSDIIIFLIIGAINLISLVAMTFYSLCRVVKLTDSFTGERLLSNLGNPG